MKIEAFSTLGWAFLASAGYIKRDPQLGGITLTPNDMNQASKGQLDFTQQILPNIKPTIISAKPQLRENAQRKILRFGPHTIPASKVDPSGVNGHMGAMGQSSTPTRPQNWMDWTLGQTIAYWTGAPSLGMQRITLGQIANFIGMYWTGGDYMKAFREIINAPQDPNGWTSHRTWESSELCQGCTVLSAKSDIVFENGSRADVSHGLYLHHTASLNMGLHLNVNWLNPCSNSEATINNFNFQEYMPKQVPAPGILSLGTVDANRNLFTSKDGNISSGLPISKGDLFYQMTEIVNYRKFDQKVYVQLDIEYVEGKLEKETVFTPLSFTGCRSAWGFTGNGTAGNITSDAFQVNWPGTVVNSRGHMHDGGTSLDILLNNKLVCSSRAIYGTQLQMDGKAWTTIKEMTDCTQHFAVQKGDQIRLVVNYDEIAHPKRDSHGEEQEEMGWMYFTFVPA